jgi:hypothetical protein
VDFPGEAPEAVADGEGELATNGRLSSPLIQPNDVRDWKYRKC